MSKGKDDLSIAFISAGDPEDRVFSSGVFYYMAKALRENCGQVSFLGPANPYALKLGEMMRHGSRLLLGKNYDFLHTLRLARAYARVFNRRISEGDYDIVFAPEVAAEIAFLATDIPIVYESDTTFSLMVDYYPFYTNLLRTSIRQGNRLEELAISKASALIYPTYWAARSAVEDYGAEESAINVIPLGPNFDYEPSRKEATGSKPSDTCRLLFMGRDWVRKGGDIAVEAFLELDRMGLPVELTICGCTPPYEISHPALTVISYLDKNDERQRSELMSVYADAHFLLMPSRAECAAFTVSEAAAFGLPVFAARTGGLSELVKEGENGFVLPLDARGVDYARKLHEVFAAEPLYSELRKSARERFESRLNWRAWSRDVLGVLESCLSRSA